MKTLASTINTDQKQNTWIGGPTYQNQEQHIPGYCGHVHGYSSESLYSKSFAKLTAQCLKNTPSSGYMINEKERLQTSYQNEFSKNKQTSQQKANYFAQTALQQIQQQKIQEELYKMKEPQSINEIQPIDRVPVVGYQGYIPVYRHPIKQVKPKPQITQEPKTDIKTLSIGFQQNLIANDAVKIEEVVTPIVGYTGFVPGIKALNKYGKPYKDTAFESKSAFKEKIKNASKKIQ